MEWLWKILSPSKQKPKSTNNDVSPLALDINKTFDPDSIDLQKNNHKSAQQFDSKIA